MENSIIPQQQHGGGYAGTPYTQPPMQQHPAKQMQQYNHGTAVFQQQQHCPQQQAFADHQQQQPTRHANMIMQQQQQQFHNQQMPYNPGGMVPGFRGQRPTFPPGTPAGAGGEWVARGAGQMDGQFHGNLGHLQHTAGTTHVLPGDMSASMNYNAQQQHQQGYNTCDNQTVAAGTTYHHHRFPHQQQQYPPGMVYGPGQPTFPASIGSPPGIMSPQAQASPHSTGPSPHTPRYSPQPPAAVSSPRGQFFSPPPPPRHPAVVASIVGGGGGGTYTRQPPPPNITMSTMQGPSSQPAQSVVYTHAPASVQTTLVYTTTNCVPAVAAVSSSSSPAAVTPKTSLDEESQSIRSHVESILNSLRERSTAQKSATASTLQSAIACVGASMPSKQSLPGICSFTANASRASPPSSVSPHSNSNAQWITTSTSVQASATPTSCAHSSATSLSKCTTSVNCSVDSLKTTVRFITVPYGWKRVVEGGNIVYYRYVQSFITVPMAKREL